MDLSRHPDTWDDSTLYADDLTVGQVFPLGTHTVTTEELLRFAEAWDPQFFHVDPAAAERGVFGGLITSGVHTMAIFQRLSVEGFWSRCATIAARGIRDVRFEQPVRPDTTLVGRLVVDQLEHRGDARSLLTVTGTLDDASGDTVLTMSVDVYLARRQR